MILPVLSLFVAVTCDGATPFSTQRVMTSSHGTSLGAGPPSQCSTPGSMDVASGSTKLIDKGFSPRWSPQDDWFAYLTAIDGTGTAMGRRTNTKSWRP